MGHMQPDEFEDFLVSIYIERLQRQAKEQYQRQDIDDMIWFFGLFTEMLKTDHPKSLASLKEHYFSINRKTVQKVAIEPLMKRYSETLTGYYFLANEVLKILNDENIIFKLFDLTFSTNRD